MAENERASFGFFPQLRRNRTAQDPEAAKNAPLAALRGFVSGVAGAPGDLESIAYMPYDYLRAPKMSELVTGEKKTKTFFPTSEEIEKRIPFRGESPVEKAFAGAGQLAGGFYYGRGSPLRVLAESPQILKRAGLDFARSIAPVNVVKPTGKGNWTSGVGSLDEAINRGNLKPDPSAGQEIPYHQMELDELLAKDAETPGRYTRTIQRVQQNLKDLQRNNALNNWVEGNLKNYMQKQMGTPDDPIRALAEQGVAHHDFPAGRYPAGNITKRRRKEAGFPEEGLAQSELAKRWENLADATINPIKAGEIRARIAAQDVNSSKYQTILDENPWLNKLPDSEVVNMTNRYNFRELGFDHMIDVLRAEVAAGRIRPEQLNRVSIEDAVKRVHAYDQEAAKKAAVEEMESMKANLSQTPYKEYGTGYKWVELPDPAASPENQKLIQNVGCQGGWCTMDEPNVFRYGEHEQGNRLYALLDQEGRPHTQIHVQQKPLPVSGEAFAMLPSAKKAEYGQMVREWRRRNPDIEELTDAHTTQALIEGGVVPEKQITQIKPFSNRWDSDKVEEFTKRNPKYRQEIEPYLQDFVKSGKWSAVGDLENTGLIRIYPESELYQSLTKMGMDAPSYATQDEITKLLKQAQVGSYRDASKGKTWINVDHPDYRPDPPAELPPEGMKRGGAVTLEDLAMNYYVPDYNEDDYYEMPMALMPPQQRMNKGGLTQYKECNCHG
jgi:hypothetical protein